MAIQKSAKNTLGHAESDYNYQKDPWWPSAFQNINRKSGHDRQQWKVPWGSHWGSFGAQEQKRLKPRCPTDGGGVGSASGGSRVVGWSWRSGRGAMVVVVVAVEVLVVVFLEVEVVVVG